VAALVGAGGAGWRGAVTRPSWLGGRLWPPAGGSRLAAGLGACPGSPGGGLGLPCQGARLRRQRLGLPRRGCLGRCLGGGFGRGPRLGG